MSTATPTRAFARWSPWGPVLFPLALLVPPLVSHQPLHYSWAIAGVLWGLWVLSLNVIWGYAGLLSLAQLSLGAITGYAVAILGSAGGAWLPLGIGGGIAVSVVASILISRTSSRLSGFYFSILTLVFALTITTVLSNWDLAGRTAGLSVPRSLLPRADILGYAFEPTSPQGFFLLAASCFLLLNALAGVLWFLPAGRAMRAVRDDIHLAQSVGFRPSSVRTFAFALSGAIAAVAGLLQAWSFQLVVPELYGLDQTLLAIMLLVMAGLGSPYAPAVAALVYLVLYEALPVDGALRLGILGVAVIVIVLVFPGGITAGVRRLFALVVRRLPHRSAA